MPWIGPAREQYIYSLGLQSLQISLGEDNLLDFPRTATNRPRLLREGYMRRLLQGQMSLLNSPASDISAAQPDLKHLSLRQALKIRVAHLELVNRTLVQTQEAFLSSLDRRLTTAVAEHAGDAAISDKVVRHIILVFGAQAYMESDETKGPVLQTPWWLVNLPPYRLFVNTHTSEVTPQAPREVMAFRSHSFIDVSIRCRMWSWEIFDLHDGGEVWDEHSDRNDDRKIHARLGVEAAKVAREVRERRNTCSGDYRRISLTCSNRSRPEELASTANKTRGAKPTTNPVDVCNTDKSPDVTGQSDAAGDKGDARAERRPGGAGADECEVASAALRDGVAPDECKGDVAAAARGDEAVANARKDEVESATSRDEVAPDTRKGKMAAGARRGEVVANAGKEAPSAQRRQSDRRAKQVSAKSARGEQQDGLSRTPAEADLTFARHIEDSSPLACESGDTLSELRTIHKQEQDLMEISRHLATMAYDTFEDCYDLPEEMDSPLADGSDSSFFSSSLRCISSLILPSFQVFTRTRTT